MFRHLLLLSMLVGYCPAAWAAMPPFPALTGRVVDQAQVLSEGDRQQIEQELAGFEQATGDQVVVATIADLKGVAIEDYGYQLGRAWGIGKKGKDNGALLIVAPKDHQTRIEVGYGLEGDLTDAASSLIIQRYMLPYFKQGDFRSGIEQGLAAMMHTIAPQVKELPAPPASAAPQQNGLPLGVFIPLLLVFLFLRRYGRNRRSGLIAPLLLGSMMSSGGSSGSGWGGGGFSGGGGSFGGGGASGRW